jgi:bisphosphoglycerate-independent phosphoglycerate mutase (AlkP superfamily)
MESSSTAVIGAILFILIVVGANFAMYAIVRGATRTGGKKSFLETFSDSFNTSPKSKDNSMDELHQKIAELNKGKKDAPSDSEK